MRTEMGATYTFWEDPAWVLEKIYLKQFLGGPGSWGSGLRDVGALS